MGNSVGSNDQEYFVALLKTADSRILDVPPNIIGIQKKRFELAIWRLGASIGETPVNKKNIGGFVWHAWDSVD